MLIVDYTLFVQMKKIIFSLIVTAMIMTMTGCGSSKGFTYLENADSISLAASRGLYDARIMPKDELTITVNTTDPDAAAPFNLQVRNQLGGGKQVASGGGSLQGYLVDNSGFINFPVIGKIHVSGLTKPECEDLIYEDAFGPLQKGNTQYYVSSGMGIWGGKFRIGTRSEYVVADIK